MPPIVTFTVTVKIFLKMREAPQITHREPGLATCSAAHVGCVTVSVTAAKWI